MQYYRFEATDVSIGNDYAIVEWGEKRFLLEGLMQKDRTWIKAVRPGQRMSPYDISTELFTSLSEKNILVKCDHTTPPYVITRTLRIPSRFVRSLSSIFQALTTLSAIIIICIVSFVALLHLILVEGFVSLSPYLGISFKELSIIIFIVFISNIFHEIGHAAACLRLTDSVGGIRFTRKGLALGMATDVTSHVKTDSKGKAIIGISGPVFQLGFCLVITIFYRLGFLSQNITYLSMSLAFLTAGLSLAPKKGRDGFKVVRNLSGKSLKPSLLRFSSETTKWDLVAGYYLLIFQTSYYAILGVILIKLCMRYS